MAAAAVPPHTHTIAKKWICESGCGCFVFYISPRSGVSTNGHVVDTKRSRSVLNHLGSRRPASKSGRLGGGRINNFYYVNALNRLGSVRAKPINVVLSEGGAWLSSLLVLFFI